MNLTSDIQLANTRRKLAELEAWYEELRSSEEEESDEHVRQLSMMSLKRLINQLKEEIVRYEVGIRT